MGAFWHFLPELGFSCCAADAPIWAQRARVNSHTADARSSGTLLVSALGFDLHVDSYLWLRINFIDDIENGYLALACAAASSPHLAPGLLLTTLASLN